MNLKEGERINLFFPGTVKIIAKDHSGKVVEINNKNDVDYATMSMRKDFLEPKIKETIETETHNSMEFE